MRDSQETNSVKNSNEYNQNHNININSHFNNYKNSESRDKFNPNVKNISVASTRDKTNSSKFNHPIIDSHTRIPPSADYIEDYLINTKNTERSRSVKGLKDQDLQNTNQINMNLNSKVNVNVNCQNEINNNP